MGIVYLDGYQNAGGGSGSQITVVANYSALPAANTVPNKFYWCSASQGTKWLPYSLGGTFYNSGLYYSNGTDWEYQETPHQATLGEVNVGVDNTKFVTAYTFTNSNKIVNSFQKNVDTSDNITEGAVQLFMTQAEKDAIANQYAYIWAVNTLNLCK